MGVSNKTFHNHVVYYDTDEEQRWIDVIGPNAVKHVEEFVSFAVDDATGNPVAYTTTEVGTDTIALVAGADGGNVLITTGATENNGLQIQLVGEAFILNGLYPAYFGVRFQINDVDQVDALIGLAITDTTAIAGCSDGAYFRTVDESAVLNFVLEKDSAETTEAAETLTDATWVVAEWYFDGTTIYAYIDGVQVASVANTDANFPNDEYLTPTIAILTGEAVANTLTVSWARWFQIRE